MTPYKLIKQIFRPLGIKVKSVPKYKWPDNPIAFSKDGTYIGSGVSMYTSDKTVKFSVGVYTRNLSEESIRYLHLLGFTEITFLHVFIASKNNEFILE